MRRLAARVLISEGNWAAIDTGTPKISYNTLNISFNLI
jgi:hypothetical protein